MKPFLPNTKAGTFYHYLCLILPMFLIVLVYSPYPFPNNDGFYSTIYQVPKYFYALALVCFSVIYLFTPYLFPLARSIAAYILSFTALQAVTHNYIPLIGGVVILYFLNKNHNFLFLNIINGIPLFIVVTFSLVAPIFFFLVSILIVVKDKGYKAPLRMDSKVLT